MDDAPKTPLRIETASLTILVPLDGPSAFDRRFDRIMPIDQAVPAGCFHIVPFK